MRLRLSLLALLLVVVTVMGTLAPPRAHAATRTVCPNGCDFPTIQTAINAAQTGDVISIAPGTYPEQLTIPGTGGATQLTLQKGLGRGGFAGIPGIPSFPGFPGFPSLPGLGSGGEVIIDGGGVGRVLTIAAGHTVALVDLTLRNGTALGDDGGGIRNSGTLRLTRCGSPRIRPRWALVAA
jgi:hypothetical protein